MHINRMVYFVTPCWERRYFAIDIQQLITLIRQFVTKFDDRFINLLGIKCIKRYLNSFRVDIFFVRCLRC